jgi:hypothetical protein
LTDESFAPALAPAATNSAILAPEPYRRRLIGLPLQRSLFARIDRSPAAIGLDRRLAARLDDLGDLYLDRGSAMEVAGAFRSALSPERVVELEAAHRARCTDLLAATQAAGSGAEAEDAAGCRAAIGHLAARIEPLVHYGIVAKFVPDALLAALRRAGDQGPPPTPVPSPGRALLDAIGALCLRCHQLGYPPDRLARAWPAVPPDVGDAIRGFGRAHAGFGPLPWDAPGHEDPTFTVAAIASAFGDVGPDELRERLAAAPGAPPAGGGPVPELRAYLAFWLEFLERETWYVRRAFFAGMLPLLRRLAQVRGEHPAERLLFWRLEELVGGDADPALVDARRAAYLADRGYLGRHGIEDARLAWLMEFA